MAKYTPPDQSKGMQFADITFLLIAIFLALWLPLKLKLAGAAKDIDKIDNPTWEKLQQTPAQVAQWEKLGIDPAKAHDVIQSHFHYDIDWLALIVMTVVLVGYFVMVFMASDREYRDVIAEKFGDGK
jgi:hypothetical protein